MQNFYNVKSEFQENYKYAHDYWSPFVTDAQVYTLAASGYTWSNNERKELQKEGREPLELNIMRQPLQFYSGFLRDNINEVVYSPVEGSDQKTAEQFTKLSYYIWDKGAGFPVFLDACDEMFKAGISLVGIHMDYSNDFINGDIAFNGRSYNQFFLDPTFEKISLEDCGFAITRDLFGRDYVKQLLPFVDPKTIDEIHNGFRDDKFLTYHPQFSTFSRNSNLLAYDQYYRRTTRKRKYLIDNENSFFRDITDLPAEEIKRLKVGLGRLTSMRNDADYLDIDRDSIPNVEIKDYERPYVELNVMLNGEHVYTGEDKTGIVSTYPFAPLLCYFEPSIWMPSQRIQGIPATVYSDQRQFNKRHMKICDMMDSTISTGFKYLIGSVPDPQEMQQSGQNKLIGVDPENAPQGLDSVQQLQGGGANPALIEYQAVLDQLSLKLANINESVLGVDDKGNTQLSGRLAQMRIAQGIRGCRKVFDNVETTQMVIGDLILECIQNTYPPGKVKRILNEQPTEQFYDKQFEQYDAVIKQGIRSQSQRDAYYSELVALKREGIVDVPQSSIVKSLPMTGVTDLEKDIEAQQKQQMEQQANIDKAQLELLNATKEEKLALAQERRTRSVANVGLEVERSSEAEENRAQAALARAKTITEIASMHDERILKVLEFVNMLEQQEAAEQQRIDDKIQIDTDNINVETQGSQENLQQQELNQLMAS